MPIRQRHTELVAEMGGLFSPLSKSIITSWNQGLTRNIEINVGESNDYSQAIFHAMLFGHRPMS